MTNRTHTETEKIKVEGLAAVYIHTEYDRPGGEPIGHQISVPGRYQDTAIHELLTKIADRINGVRQ